MEVRDLDEKVSQMEAADGYTTLEITVKDSEA